MYRQSCQYCFVLKISLITIASCNTAIYRESVDFTAAKNKGYPPYLMDWARSRRYFSKSCVFSLDILYAASKIKTGLWIRSPRTPSATHWCAQARGDTELAHRASEEKCTLKRCLLIKNCTQSSIVRCKRLTFSFHK